MRSAPTAAAAVTGDISRIGRSIGLVSADLRDGVTDANGHPRRGRDRRQHPGPVRSDVILHLHGLDYADGLTEHHRLAGSHRDADHGALDRATEKGGFAGAL